MSSGSVRRVSRQDIQLVQNLIERCLQLYMNQKEVVETLLEQAKIEPGFTELVWQKLEEENREFFKAYYMRLMVKHQIMEFNKLLEQQVQLMRQMHTAGVSPVPTTNGSHIQSLNSKQACYGPDQSDLSLKPENPQHHIGSSFPNTFSNGGSTLNTNISNAVDMSVHSTRVEPQPHLLSQVPNMTLMQGMNGGMIKSEVAYPGCSPYIYGGEGNVLESRSTVGDAPVGSFSSAESNTQAVNDQLLDADTSSFGFLGQIPRNFSLSDLTADFAHSSDILDSYDRSPFLATDAENFLNSRERGEYQGENKRLETISEGFSYEKLSQ